MQRPPLSLEEIDLLERSATARERLILRMLYETGCTVGELVALRVGDVKLSRGILHVARRRLPLSAHLSALIRQGTPRGRRSSAPLFSSRESATITPRRVEQILASLGRRALGSQITPHQLRSSRIIHDFLQRVPIVEIERKVGLQSIRQHLYAYYAASTVSLSRGESRRATVSSGVTR